MSVQYSIPDYVRVSAECRHLLSRIFVANPAKASIINILSKHATDTSTQFKQAKQKQ